MTFFHFFEKVLDKGFNSDYNWVVTTMIDWNTTNLLEAVRYGLIGRIEELLANGTDINEKGDDGRTALIQAAVKEQTETAKWLLEHGADVNATDKVYGNTPLHWAAWSGCTEMVNLLLDNGADINAKDNEGKTPLHWAAKYRRSTKACKLLLEHGAEVNVKDDWGETPLHKAAYEGQLKNCQQLLEHGAEVDIKDKEGKTPLLEALVWYKSFKIVKILLEHGADVNTKDNDGNTPLHDAVDHEPKLLKLLLDNGADVFAKNKDGKTPIEVSSPSCYWPDNHRLLTRYANKLIKKEKEAKIASERATNAFRCLLE